MEEMVKNFKSIENGIARYIYKKYIMPKNITEEDTPVNEDSITEEDEDTEDKEDIEEEIVVETESVDSVAEVAAKVNTEVNTEVDNKLYKIYLQRIFDFERHLFRILQDDVLKEDLKKMEIADKAYELNPNNFNPMEYDSLPDVLRCTFIRKYKHRYYRCKNRVINNDSDICKKHENSENIYIDRYNELLSVYEPN